MLYGDRDWTPSRSALLISPKIFRYFEWKIGSHEYVLFGAPHTMFRLSVRISHFSRLGFKVMARQRRLAPASTIIHRYGVSDILLHNVEYQHQGKRRKLLYWTRVCSPFFFCYFICLVYMVFLLWKRKKRKPDRWAHRALFCNAARLTHIFHRRNILAKGVLFFVDFSSFRPKHSVFKHNNGL